MILSWVRIFNWYRNRKIKLEIFYQDSISSSGLFTMNEEHFPWWRKKIGLLRLQHVKAKNIICEGLNTEDIYYIKYLNFPFLNSPWTSVWWLDDFWISELSMILMQIKQTKVNFRASDNLNKFNINDQYNPNNFTR